MMTWAVSPPEKSSLGRHTKRLVGIKAKTINDTDFAALRAVFGWATAWMDVTNPAVGSKDRGSGKKRTREPWFSEDERADPQCGAGS